MKPFLLLSIFIFSFYFVNAQTNLGEQRKKWEFNQWQQMFKDRALCLCILEGYQDSSLKRNILKIDRSLYDPIGYAIFDPALVPFIQREAESISIKAKKSYERVSEAKAGKLVFNHCLDLYKSKRLEQLVQKTSVSWYKIKDIDEIISREIPAY